MREVRDLAGVDPTRQDEAFATERPVRNMMSFVAEGPLWLPGKVNCRWA